MERNCDVILRYHQRGDFTVFISNRISAVEARFRRKIDFEFHENNLRPQVI